MSKQQTIYDLLRESTHSLSSGEWPDFLRSAAWNFRFPFLAQSLIYAQRPDATACYTFDDWHKKFNRRIKAHSKGIALLDDRKDQLALSYVFDYKDTYSPAGRELTSWQLTGAKEPTVRETLLRELLDDVPPALDLESDARSFYSGIVSSLLDEHLADTLPELQAARLKSRLVRFSDDRAETIYRSLLQNSVTAAVMYRCGLDPELDASAFADAAYFNTNETMSILGNATQVLSSRILREIAYTVAAWDKAHQHEEEKTNEKQLNISADRGIPDPAPDHTVQPRAEEIRATAQEIPAGAQDQPVHLASDERSADGPSAPDGRADAAAGERDDVAPSGAEPGSHEREGESGLDTAHGDAETPGGGTGPSGDDLYLKYFSNRDMESAILAGPDIEGGKFRIQRAFEEQQPNLTKLLSREYGQGGRTFLFPDGTEGQLTWDSMGIGFHAPDHNPAFLSWHTVHNRIRDLVENNRYLDTQEQLQAQRYFADQESLHLREELGVTLRAFFSIYGARDHDSITRNEEDLRAFIYENSKTARAHLLSTFGAFTSHPTVLQDEIAHHTLTELLDALGDDSRPEFTSQIPSATDLGIVNPFPSEVELAEEEYTRTHPLAREPLQDFPSLATMPAPDQEHAAPPAALTPFGTGEVVNLSGTEYTLLEVNEDTVLLQDTQHPLFTQELPIPVLRTILANTETRGTQSIPSHPVESQETADTSSAVKETDITDIAAESQDLSLSEMPALPLRNAIAAGLRQEYDSFLKVANDSDLPDTDELQVILDDFEATGNPYYGRDLTASQEQELRTVDYNLKAIAATAFRMQMCEDEHIRNAASDVIAVCCALCQIEESALLDLAKTSDWISVTPEEPARISEVAPEPVQKAVPKQQRRGENAARKTYKLLNDYAPYLLDGTLDYVRFESDTYEPLYIERISDREIAIAHTMEQNGDLIVDPEMVFWVDEDAKALWPVSIEQPIFGGFIQRVYDYGDSEYVRPNLSLERDLTSFFRTWMQNLKWQDHQPVRGVKHSIDGDQEYIFQDGKPVVQEPEVDLADSEGVKEPAAGDIYNQFLPMVLDRVLKDQAYFNALQYADEENLKIECDAAIGRAVLSINDMQLHKLYYDHAEYHDRLHRDILTQSREHTPQHNPEPEIDHPELRTARHFPAVRADKEELADLLLFVTDYRSTFERQRPELSAHDSEAYREASEFIDSCTVTDSIFENLDNIRKVVNYINAWFMPFSEGLNPEFVEATYQMLAKAGQLDAQQILQAESESEEALPSEAVTESEGASEPSEGIGEEGQYDASSFHVGDYYEDANSRGVITNVYVPEEGVPHEPSFSLVDPDAPEDSRDAKGYVISIPTAIVRLSRGEATLSASEKHSEPANRSADREEGELSLFDFQFDAPSEPANTAAPVSEPPQPVIVQASQGSISQDERINFRLPSETIPLGGPKARFQNNVAAIRLLKQLEGESRLATAKEQELLSKYVGWGGLADAFDPAKTNWSSEYSELKGLLTDEEYEAARESTLTAFYTPPEVIDAIYQVLRNLGFQKGNILDPGCGIGSFSGRLPEEWNDSKIYGIEKDSLSGRIARQLYQQNNIAIEGYEDTKLPDNFFDVAVGNVPFGNFKVSDRRYDKLNLQVHDYFFAKTLDKVRPGGVIAFVTSMGTMDKQSADFRRYLSQRADLLGAIRLPNNTFKTNAGTDVTSDIIFLQKREFPRVEEAYWTDLDRSYNYDSNTWGEEVNAYFAANPEMVLGEMKEISGPHGPELACIAVPGQDLKTELSDAVSRIQGAMEEPEQGLYDQEYEERERIPADPDVRNFSFTLVDDEIYFREDSEMFRVETGKKGEERIRGLIELRDTVYALIDAQVEGYSDEAIRFLQRKLNDKYDTFTAKNGLINSRGNSMVFSDDSSYYLLCSLEHVNEKGEFLGKADMFYKRTIHAHQRVEHVESAQEALAVSLGERGRIDFGFMSELSGLDREALIDQLRGQIFEDPVNPGHFEIAALYLSGNVREKLAQARAAASEEPDIWEANVRALESVQPKDLEPADITARIGSTWIPAEDYTQFMYDLFQTPSIRREGSYGTMKVHYSPYTNIWNITNNDWDNWNSRATSTYGSHRMNGYKILEHTLNLKDVKIFDTVRGDDNVDRRVLNEAETIVVQEKQQQIRDAFKEWIWEDPARAERLCRVYNERFNSYVPPKFDGQLVQFHNMNPNVTMRPWQRDAVARILYNGNTLLAHAVGAGKTWTMSAAAKEMKYLGLCNKSMIVVPNHLVGQWASAIYEQYPDAKILASTKKDFETKNRKKFCSRIATGDYDIVIIGHSQFERIPLSHERQESGIRAEIQKIIDGIAEMKAERAEHFTIKQMERMKKSLETRLDKLNNSKKRDDVITFEQLGVDRLFVDESHDYKNLFLYTKMQNVAGISQTDSQKASDMYLKCRYMDELTGNKGNIHATGTPLSNTMAELYTTQRYLQYDLLEEMGLSNFDQWASTFGETVTSIELAPEGTGYRARTRFANFFNIPELMSLYCQVADIQTSDMLDLPLPTPHYENIVVPASQIQKDYVQELGQRAQKIRNGIVKSDVDNMLCVTNDGRKLALDQRLIDPDWPDDPNSKVNACADNIHRIWTESSATKGTQLVFCDISTPTGKGFNVYDDLKEKLIARGIPAEEIRFIHEANTDAQKEALFQKVRDGDVRILMGSTSKMGTGTNVQNRLVAGHDLDCPWRPSDLEQRAGRVIRQGNTNKDVYMYRYVTEGTFDAYLYQLVENKQRFISQIYTSKPAARSASDVDEIVLSFAEIKALASGNPLIKERVELEGEIQRLQLLKSRHENTQFRLKRKATQELPQEIASTKKQVSSMEKDVALITHYPSRTEDNRMLPVTVKGKVYEQAKDAGLAILNAVKRAPKDTVTPIGTLRNFTLSVDNTPNSWGKYAPNLELTGPGMTYHVTPSDSPVGTVVRLNNMLDTGIQEKLKYKQEYLCDMEHELQTAISEMDKPFTRAAELSVKQQRLTELTRLLNLDAQQEEPDVPAVAPQEQAQEKGAKPSLSSLIESAQLRQGVHTYTDHSMPHHERA